MNFIYLDSILIFLAGVSALIVYMQDSHPKEKDKGKDVSILLMGIAATIGGLIIFLLELFKITINYGLIFGILSLIIGFYALITYIKDRYLKGENRGFKNIKVLFAGILGIIWGVILIKYGVALL